MTRTGKNAMRLLFPLAFICACVLFWWSPSILLAWLRMDVDLKPWTLEISVVALCVFLFGYLFSFRLLRRPLIAPRVMAMSNDFAFKATVALAIPALIVGAKFAIYRAGVVYGEGHSISLSTQAVLYLHMFFAYLFLGSVPTCKGKDRRKIIWAIALVLTPRILITLHWGRFFAGQTIVAILFIALARGWMKMSLKRWIQLLLIALLVFLGPVLIRDKGATKAEIEGGSVQVVRFFTQGSTLHFFQEYHDNLRSDCPPLLVSMTERVVPYNALGVCTIQVGSVKGVPETVDNLLTRQDSNNLMTGTGSIYVFGLYMAGGVPGIIVGSFLFGMCCRWWVERLGHASLFAGIWAECLVRSLFAPRGSLGYVFQRIPSLILATLGVILLCQLIDILHTRSPALAAEG
jgi:hypothetical protein